jgi:hypothetical protein
MTKEMNITVGSIVKIKNGVTPYYRGNFRVTSIRGGKANLGTIFGRHIYYKGVPVENLKECEKEWYAAWQQSETYQCM